MTQGEDVPGPDAPGTPPGGPRRRRWPWVLPGSLLLGALALRALLPLAVERGAAWGSRQYLGLPVRIQNADFALLQGRVALEGIRVGARPDGVSPFEAALAPPPIEPEAALLQVERIATRLSWSDLRDRTARLTELVLESPTVRLEREPDGAIRPLRHAEPAAPPAGGAAPSEPDGEADAPWTLALDRFDLRDPRVSVVDGADGERLLDFSLADLLLETLVTSGGDVSLGGLGIEAPVLRVQRVFLLGDPDAAPAPSPDGVAEPSPAAEPPADAGAAPDPAKRPSYTLDRIDVQRATFTWLTDDAPLDVALTLRASEISTEEGSRFPLALRLEVEEGVVTLEGEAGAFPPSFNGTLRWSALPFPSLLLAGMPEVAPWLRSASSTGTLEIETRAPGEAGSARVQLAGRFAVDRLDVEAPREEEVSIGWAALEVAVGEVVVPLPVEGEPSGTTRVRLDGVTLREPTILYTLPSPQLDALLGADAEPAGPAPPAAAETPVPGEAASPPLDLAIASVELVDGDVAVLDRTVEPAVRSTIRELDFSARDVRYPALQALDARLAAVLPEGAALSVTGDLRSHDQGDFTLELVDLSLPVFASYAAAAGAEFEEGTASVKTDARLRGGRIEIDNDLLLKHLAVSLRDPAWFEQQFGVPIDLALALLRDPRGSIRLSIPVGLERGASSVDLASILRSAVRQALVGALSAPLKVAGVGFSGLAGVAGRVGGTRDGSPVAPVPIAAGATEPGADGSDRVAALATLLAQRPGLTLVLRGRAGPADRAVLARRSEGGGAEADMPEVASEDGGGERPGLLSRVLGVLGGRPDRRDAGEEAPPEPAAGEDEEGASAGAGSGSEPPLRRLAAQRAERLRERLLETGVDPSRVVLETPAPEGTPGVVIELRAG